MVLHQTKNFSTAKESIKRMKKKPTEWEKIFTSDTSDKRLVSKIYKELIKLKPPKQTIQLKNGHRI